MALHLYDIILRPIISEKQNELTADHNQYVFEVAMDANKIQIKEAIEALFEVKVTKVNTLIMPPKRGQRGRRTYWRTKAFKKAIVTLADGDQIEDFTV